MAEESLWVHLVTKERPTGTLQWGSGITLRVVALEERNRVPFLEAVREAVDGNPPITVFLSLRSNNVRSLTWIEDSKDILVTSKRTETYADTVEDQAEAEETIREFLTGMAANDRVFKNGPHRIEIEFAELAEPMKVISGVVISCLEPSGQFKEYACQVKRWTGAILAKTSVPINELTHRILAIHEVCVGAVKSELSLHLPDCFTAKGSFDKLYEYWEEIPQTERSRISGWTPAGSYHQSDLYTGQSGYGQSFYGSGYTAKPAPALMRKAGDAEGVKAFEEQEKRSDEGKHLWGLEEVALAESTKSTPPPVKQYPEYEYD